MLKTEALTIARAHGIPLDVDFHSLPSDTVACVLAAADARKYRAPSGANGSRARYFHAMLCRASRATVPEYVVQSNYAHGHGWEDVAPEDSMREAKKRLKEYRANAPEFSYRLITRRVPA